jgi:hypothetical protein
MGVDARALENPPGRRNPIKLFQLFIHLIANELLNPLIEGEIVGHSCRFL